MVKPRSAQAVNRSDLLVNSGPLATDLKMVGFWGGVIGGNGAKKQAMFDEQRETQRYLGNFSRFHFFVESNSRYGFLDKKGKQHDGLYKHEFHDDAI